MKRLLNGLLVVLMVVAPVSGVLAGTPSFLPEARVGFAPVGTPGAHYLAASGTFSPKRYWFYEPDIDPVTGKGWIRFELTDHAGILRGMPPYPTLGVVLDILDANGRSVFHLVHQTVMNKPGKAQAYNVAFSPAVLASLKTVVLHPFTDVEPLDDPTCGVAVGIALDGDGVHGPIVASCAPETSE